MRSGMPGLNLTDSVYERLLAERIIFLGSQVDDDIANRLCVSTRTVEGHIYRAMKKTGTAGREELAALLHQSKRTKLD